MHTGNKGERQPMYTPETGTHPVQPVSDAPQTQYDPGEEIIHPEYGWATIVDIEGRTARILVNPKLPVDDGAEIVADDRRREPQTVNLNCCLKAADEEPVPQYDERERLSPADLVYEGRIGE